MECKELISVFRRPFSKEKTTHFFRLVPTPGTCFKLKNILVPVVSFLMIALNSQPAYANNPPGSLGEVLFAYMIPVATIMMTLLSGGYAIQNRLKAAKEKPEKRVITVLKSVVRISFWVFAIIYSMAFMGAAMYLGIICGIYALYRSYMLIRWGLAARRGIDKPDYLTDAKPTRLIYSGSALIMMTVVLSALALMFVAHSMYHGDYGIIKRHEEAVFKSLVSIEAKKLTYLEDKKAFQEELDDLSVQTEDLTGKMRDAKRRYIVEYQADQKGFTAFLLPATGNILFTYSSYRADYTADGKGQIRRAWVHNRDERCPEKAEVIHTEHPSLEEKNKQLAMGARPSAYTAHEIRRDGRFIAYDNGTVLDTRTNLMWAARDNGSDVNWKSNKSYCENYRGGGYTDWRMPTTNELAELYDSSKSYSATQRGYNVYLTELIQLSACCPWASETRGSDAAYFDFLGGNRGWSPRSFGFSRALPVRSAK